MMYAGIDGVEVHREGDRVALEVPDGRPELDHDAAADLANAIAAAGVDAAPHGGRS
jgi:hypothetical protein